MWFSPTAKFVFATNTPNADGSAVNTTVYSGADGQTWAAAALTSTDSNNWGMSVSNGSVIVNVNCQTDVSVAHASTDGVNWSTNALPAAWVQANAQANVLALGQGGVFLLLSDNGGNQLYSTSDGVNWTASTLPVSLGSYTQYSWSNNHSRLYDGNSLLMSPTSAVSGYTAENAPVQSMTIFNSTAAITSATQTFYLQSSPTTQTFTITYDAGQFNVPNNVVGCIPYVRARGTVA